VPGATIAAGDESGLKTLRRVGAANELAHAYAQFVRSGKWLIPKEKWRTQQPLAVWLAVAQAPVPRCPRRRSAGRHALPTWLLWRRSRLRCCLGNCYCFDSCHRMIP